LIVIFNRKDFAIMDMIIAMLMLFLAPSGQGFILFCFSIVLLAPLIKVLYRTKIYFLNFEYPEPDYTSVTPLGRWWSGFVLAIILLAQIIILFIYFLPLLLGIVTLFFSEVFYLQNPESPLFYHSLPLNYGQVGIITGIAYVIGGLLFWGKNMHSISKNSWLYSTVIKIDTAAFFIFAGISLFMIVLSSFYGNRINSYCMIISYINMSVFAGIAVYRIFKPLPIGPMGNETPSDGDKIEYDPSPRISHSRKFQFSKLKDVPPEDDREEQELRE
jgi:hypothetical protein